MVENLKLKREKKILKPTNLLTHEYVQEYSVYIGKLFIMVKDTLIMLHGNMLCVSTLMNILLLLLIHWWLTLRLLWHLPLEQESSIQAFLPETLRKGQTCLSAAADLLQEIRYTTSCSKSERRSIRAHKTVGNTLPDLHMLGVSQPPPHQGQQLYQWLKPGKRYKTINTCTIRPRCSG